MKNMLVRYQQLVPATSALVVALWMSACGSTSNNDQNNKVPPEDKKITQLRQVAGKINGDWISDCKVEENSSSLNKLSFTDETSVYKKEVIKYDDKYCSDVLFTVSVEGTYEVGLTVDDLLFDEVNIVDFEIDRVTFMPMSDDAASRLQASKFCAINSWKNGEPSDVTGKSCDTESGKIWKGIFTVTEDDSLLIKEAAGERPKALSLNSTSYKRQ